MNHADQILLAAALGFAVAFLVCYWERWLYERYLKRKSAPVDRTPAMIGDEFHYIVPETEYVELMLARRSVRQSSQIAASRTRAISVARNGTNTQA